MQENEQTMQALEKRIGYYMRFGVALAIVVMVIGLGLALIHPVHESSQFPTELGAIYQGLLQGSPLAYMMTGLLILIFTPVLRVVTSIVSFAKMHDQLYTVITLLVLCILIFAMWLGYVQR
ncbi:DUF1634 domain-containing protein [Weissella halotolerans]|uniref:Integral membrane protein n=1 Tax=Weissella halotolerans DSM 20190 TaxID=1123500 RepID=A0A0R2FWH9_9LACO|nr:DUF1634 domain-containing protein [Weissella halotolerans]KRN31766.1 hypothetical protein IV68_GL001023 [Weissella halotolerans DSM 20190]